MKMTSKASLAYIATILVSFGAIRLESNFAMGLLSLVAGAIVLILREYLKTK